MKWTVTGDVTDKEVYTLLADPRADVITEARLLNEPQDKNLLPGTLLKLTDDGKVALAQPGDAIFGILAQFVYQGQTNAQVITVGSLNRNAIKFSDGAPITREAELSIRPRILLHPVVALGEPLGPTHAP